jgi:IS30 family transposase
MAGLLGRAPSTVSREISRNGGYDGYRDAASATTSTLNSRIIEID